jgi:hypothetical protein
VPALARGQTGPNRAGPAGPLAERIAAIKKEQQERDKKVFDGLGAAGNDDKIIAELNQEYHAAKLRRDIMWRTT